MHAIISNAISTFHRYKKIRPPKKISQSLWKPYFNARVLKFHKRLSFRPIAILGYVILIMANKLRWWLS